MSYDMDMEVEMDSPPISIGGTSVPAAHHTGDIVKEVIYNEQMEMEMAAAMPRSSLKKSSLCRTRGSMPFNKRKKVSFDNTATQSSSGGRRARSLSPPFNRRTTFKLKRQSEEFMNPTSPTLLESDASGPDFHYNQKASDTDDDTME